MDGRGDPPSPRGPRSTNGMSAAPTRMTVGASTPATVGWKSASSSWSPTKYHGALATTGVTLPFASSSRGALSEHAHEQQEQADHGRRGSSARSESRCGQVRTVSSGSFWDAHHGVLLHQREQAVTAWRPWARVACRSPSCAARAVAAGSVGPSLRRCRRRGLRSAGRGRLSSVMERDSSGPRAVRRCRRPSKSARSGPARKMAAASGHQG